MQRGLIDHRAGEQRLAGVVLRDSQTPKPVGPLTTRVTLDPDLIDQWLIWISVWGEFAWHDPVPGVAGQNRLDHLLDLQGA